MEAKGRPPQAVVLPTGHPRAVAIIRSLGRAGVPLSVANKQPSASGMLSRFAAERYHLPTDAARILDWLEGFGRERGGVLFPTSDELLVAVSKQHERFAKFFALTAPPWSVLGPLMDRKQFYATCDALGLRTPLRFAPRDPWPFARNLLQSLPRDRRQAAVQRLVKFVQRRRPLIDATGTRS